MTNAEKISHKQMGKNGGFKINAEVIRMSENSVKEQIHNEQKQI